MKFLQDINKLIGDILQLTENKYYTQNSKHLPFCDMVYFVSTWSLFAGPVTFAIQHQGVLVSFSVESFNETPLFSLTMLKRSDLLALANYDKLETTSGMRKNETRTALIEY